MSLAERRLLAREATISTALAASLAAVLLWATPPGIDWAAHTYQRTFLLQHGFAIWNNFWYAGRYSFVTYSLLYYPLAALLGIRLLAVATVATAAYAFAAVLWRQWGPSTRWSSRTFAVVWAGIVLSAAFPFALGAALALLALWALQARAHWRFALLAALTLAASPLAFLLLVLVIAGPALARRRPTSQLVVPVFALAFSWNVSPLVTSAQSGETHPDKSAAYWAPAVRFLHKHLQPGFRVEAVDTAGHWPAVYLARAGIPIARGWFRQDDFPQNE